MHGGWRLAGANGDVGQAQRVTIGCGQGAQHGERALQHADATVGSFFRVVLIFHSIYQKKYINK